MNYARHLGGEVTTSDRIHPKQVPNSEGAFVFQVTPWERLERWLILGAEGGTYYASERQLTRENAATVRECLDTEPARAVRTIVEISQWGRAPKQSPAIFALALAASHTAGVDPALAQIEAFRALPMVCRTASHLFEFVSYVDAMRGWGQRLRRAVGSWYASKAPEQLDYQLMKYRNRNGWTHRDVLRKAHPDSALFSGRQAAIIRWAVAGAGAMGERDVRRRATDTTERQDSVGELPERLARFEELQRATTATEAARLIRAHGFTHEMVPSELKSERAVWEALLPGMPLGALVRNLGKLTEIGILAARGEEAAAVAARITDIAAIRRSRLHPIALLSAQMVYRTGHGVKGKLSWTPAPEIAAALESAFYLAFGNVEPSGKRLLLALDVSGSMQDGAIAGVPGLTPAQASAAMALVTLRREPNAAVMGFSHAFIPLDVRADMSLDRVQRAIGNLPFGGTDCSLPMRWAQQFARDKPIEGFAVYTDNETNGSREHPFEALRRYSAVHGPARLAVAAFTSTGFTIANKEDGGMLDVVGFDASAPAVLSDFFRGKRGGESIGVDETAEP